MDSFWTGALAVGASLGGIGGGIGALGAWRSAVLNNRSNRLMAVATTDLRDIEASRRRSELTPQFRLTLTEDINGVARNGNLKIELIGPSTLDYLDEVTIRIVNEAWKDHCSGRLPTNVTAEEAARFVWGPWEFNAGASAQVSDNRTTKPRPYSRVTGKNWDIFSLHRTQPGHWMAMDSAQWQEQEKGPLRLSLSCSRAPYEPWFLLAEVGSDQPAITGLA
ncbi:hypothetical protein [Actinomadura monticuli]|uniref:Uncharacterized protein n=1 Tax=Actinomadura monticuli TaxID=3097367 RepID=A0ABV4QN38_9ACTN